MHPLSEGGAAIQNLFIVSDIDVNNLDKQVNIILREFVWLERFAEMSEIPHPATKLYSVVPSPMLTKYGNNMEILPVTNGTNKYNSYRYLQNLIMLILSFLLVSRYNFSTFPGDKAVDSVQGVAGISDTR